MNPYIGNELQLYGVEEYILVGGFKDGVKMLKIKNACGVEMSVCLSRNADITSLSFKGVNLSYLTPNGISHPCYREAPEDGWIKHFMAGFLTTCGYENVGVPCEVDGVKYPLHGSINYVPVESYSSEVNDEEIIVKCIVLDESIFGRKIKRVRTIKLCLNEPKFSIDDEFQNRGDKETPLLILYHFNLGYPLLKEDSVLAIDSSEVVARNKHAQELFESHNEFQKPTPGFEEVVYFHKMKSNIGKASLYSPSEKIGLRMEYDSLKLPFFSQWKMMGVRDYVLGLEPGNVTPEGYAVNKEKGRIKLLKPNEKLSYKIAIELYENN